MGKSIQFLTLQLTKMLDKFDPNRVVSKQIETRFRHRVSKYIDEFSDGASKRITKHLGINDTKVQQYFNRLGKRHGHKLMEKLETQLHHYHKKYIQKKDEIQNQPQGIVPYMNDNRQQNDEIIDGPQPGVFLKGLEVLGEGAAAYVTSTAVQKLGQTLYNRYQASLPQMIQYQEVPQLYGSAAQEMEIITLNAETIEATTAVEGIVGTTEAIGTAAEVGATALELGEGAALLGETAAVGAELAAVGEAAAVLSVPVVGEIAAVGLAGYLVYKGIASLFD